MRAVAVLAATTLVFAPGAAQPATSGWSASGPEGGEVFALAVDPTAPRTVYAATDGGIFKSTDGAASWTRASHGLPHDYVRARARAIALDPKRPQTLYAAAGEGVLKSVDGGRSWTLAKRLGLWTVETVVVATSSPRTVYALVPGGWFAAELWRSADGGASWTLARKELPLRGPHALAVDPFAAGTLYLGGDRGLFRSRDGGRTWSGQLAAPICSIAADPASRGTLYAGGQDGRVRVTTDGGAHWRELSTLPDSDRVNVLAVDPEAGLLWAGTSRIYRSADGGRSWSAAGPRLGEAVASIAPGAVVLAASERGVWRSTGAGWTPANGGLVATIVGTVAADPVRPQVAYATVRQAVFATADGGVRWRAAGELPVEGADAVDLAIDPKHPATVYAAALVYPGPSGGLVLKSTDGARTWRVVKRDIRAVALALDPSRPNAVYAGSIREGVFKSTDGGATWRHSGGTAPLNVQALAIDPLHPSTLYAGTYGSKGSGFVYRSTDGAATWKEVAGLPSSGVWAIAVDPRRAGTVYVAMTEGVFRSDDRGSTWRRVTAGLPPSDPDGVNAVMQLVPDPKRANVLYAGHTEAGVFVTTNGGRSWRSANAGLPNRSVISLAVGANGKSLFAGTIGNGVAVAALPLPAR